MIPNKLPKRKKCQSCNQLFQPMQSFQKACSVKCAIDYVKNNPIEVKIQADKRELEAWKKRKKEGLQKLKTLGQHESEARRVFQAWVRKRDKDRPCVSCGTTESEIWDGSHLFKAELYSGLIFHEKNVHKACRKCNYFLGGNEAGYKDGLIARYGKEYLEELEAIKDEKRNYKYSKEELIEIKNIYKAKIKEL